MLKPSPKEPPGALRLTLLPGGKEGFTFQPSSLPAAIGRSRACAIRLQDPKCSRRHALVRFSHERYEVHDLGSTNGVRVNGHRVRKASLSTGDRLALGTSEFLVEILPAAGSAVPPARTFHAPSTETLPVALAAGLGIAFLFLVWGLLRYAPGSHAPPPEPPARPGRSPETPIAPPTPGEATPPRAPSAQAEAERIAAGLSAAEAAVRSGHLGLARASLLATLEAGGKAAGAESVRERLAKLDLEIQERYEQGTVEADAHLSGGRFPEARHTLAKLREDLAGLLWEALVERRLRDLAEAERKAAQAVEAARRAEEARARAEAEAARSREERERSRAAWRSHQESLLKLVSGMSPSKRVQRSELARQIAAFDPAVERPLSEALAREHQKLTQSLRARLKPDRAEELRSRLLLELDARRKAALALIRDQERYPYLHGQPNPYGPKGAETQREVDRLVEAVRQVWEAGALQTTLLKEDPRTNEVLEKLEELEEFLDMFGMSLEPAASLKGVIASFQATVDLSKESETRATHQQIFAENEKAFEAMKATGLCDDQEAACVRITNRYRVMMGLPPLRIDERLCQAARKHSADMGRRGYFSHTTPEGQGPGERVRAAGFPGPAGENIFMGSDLGEAAFAAWKGSSGHHRNMLGALWNRIGVGRSGAHWTMLPGVGP